ncbi:MAG: SPOR domain-containing protein [Gammaproteobacteria bacterium]|nr:SPOR domain-containing protein [Gammaproteobacteria bacterium]
MARDYKNRSGRKRDRGGGLLAGLLTFVAGVVTGVCAVIIVYFVNGIPGIDDFMDERHPATVPSVQPADEQKQTAGKQSPPASPTPKFDFYTILPEMEVSVPEWEREAKVTPLPDADAPNAPPQAITSEKYILQIGSFRQHDEAERVKAQLALFGIETEIQRVVIDGGDIWHRVRAGPYQSADQLDQTRQRLIENDIDFMLLKLKQDG